MRRLERLHEQRLHRRAFVRAEDAVIVEARVERAPGPVVDQLFGERVTERLMLTAVGLPARGQRIDDRAGIQRDKQVVHRRLPGLDIHRDLGKLRTERRRADRADERRRPHNLVLVLLVGGVHRNIAKRNSLLLADG